MWELGQPVGKSTCSQSRRQNAVLVQDSLLWHDGKYAGWERHSTRFPTSWRYVLWWNAFDLLSSHCLRELSHGAASQESMAPGIAPCHKSVSSRQSMTKRGAPYCSVLETKRASRSQPRNFSSDAAFKKACVFCWMSPGPL